MTDTRVNHTELMNAPCCDSRIWPSAFASDAYVSDGRLVASTDKPMTAEPTQHRARRMLGEQVTFKRGHDDGSYLEWLTPRPRSPGDPAPRAHRTDDRRQAHP